ncbi:hypothetical protein H311_02561, partial [Anncaliia algerae PRA109]
ISKRISGQGVINECFGKVSKTKMPVKTLHQQPNKTSAKPQIEPCIQAHISKIQVAQPPPIETVTKPVIEPCIQAPTPTPVPTPQIQVTQPQPIQNITKPVIEPCIQAPAPTPVPTSQIQVLYPQMIQPQIYPYFSYNPIPTYPMTNVIPPTQYPNIDTQDCKTEEIKNPSENIIPTKKIIKTRKRIIKRPKDKTPTTICTESKKSNEISNCENCADEHCKTNSVSSTICSDECEQSSQIEDSKDILSCEDEGKDGIDDLDECIKICLEKNKECKDKNESDCSKDCTIKCGVPEENKECNDCIDDFFFKNKKYERGKPFLKKCKDFAINKGCVFTRKYFNCDVKYICKDKKAKKISLKYFKKCLDLKLNKLLKKQKEGEMEDKFMEKVTNLFLFLGGVSKPESLTNKIENLTNSFSFERNSSPNKSKEKSEDCEKTSSYNIKKRNKPKGKIFVNFKKNLLNELLNKSREILNQNSTYNNEKSYKLLNEHIRKTVKDEINKQKDIPLDDKPLLDRIGEEIIEISKKIEDKKTEIGDAITENLKDKPEENRDKKDMKPLENHSSTKPEIKPEENNTKEENKNHELEDPKDRSDIADSKEKSKQDLSKIFVPYIYPILLNTSNQQENTRNLINRDYMSMNLSNSNYNNSNITREPLLNQEMQKNNNLENKISQSLKDFGYKPTLGLNNFSPNFLPKQENKNLFPPTSDNQMLEGFGYTDPTKIPDDDVYIPENQPKNINNYRRVVKIYNQNEFPESLLQQNPLRISNLNKVFKKIPPPETFEFPNHPNSIPIKKTYAISRLDKYNHSHLLPVEHNAFHKPLIIDDSSQNINLEPYDRKSEER